MGTFPNRRPGADAPAHLRLGSRVSRPLCSGRDGSGRPETARGSGRRLAPCRLSAWPQCRPRSTGAPGGHRHTAGSDKQRGAEYWMEPTASRHSRPLGPSSIEAGTAAKKAAEKAEAGIATGKPAWASRCRHYCRRAGARGKSPGTDA